MFGNLKYLIDELELYVNAKVFWGNHDQNILSNVSFFGAMRHHRVPSCSSAMRRDERHPLRHVRQ